MANYIAVLSNHPWLGDADTDICYRMLSNGRFAYELENIADNLTQRARESEPGGISFMLAKERGNWKGQGATRGGVLYPVYGLAEEMDRALEGAKSDPEVLSVAADAIELAFEERGFECINRNMSTAGYPSVDLRFSASDR